MGYDAEELEYINTVNGFDIRYDENETYNYVIFHPNYSLSWIDAFQSLREAEDFCREENADSWETDIKLGYRFN